MTREELTAAIENLGESLADTDPHCSELLEILYCIMKTQREEALLKYLTPFVEAEINCRTELGEHL